MTTPQELDERYGRRRPRRGLAIVGGAATAAVVAVGLWWMGGSSLDTVDATDLGYVVIDEHTVELRFSVSAPRESAAYCALQALDETKGIVGWKIVGLPPGSEHTRGFVEHIPTVALATTGLVKSCWVS